jgi:hypothetical protein
MRVIHDTSVDSIEIPPNRFYDLSDILVRHMLMTRKRDERVCPLLGIGKFSFFVPYILIWGLEMNGDPVLSTSLNTVICEMIS